MSYRIGWGAGARHYAVSAETASDALDALYSLELYCQSGVVVIADGIGEVPREALEYIAASERGGDAGALPVETFRPAD